MEYNNSGVHAGDGEALSTIATLAEHERWMRLALDEGKRAACAGEIPIGAVVVNAPLGTLRSTRSARRRSILRPGDWKSARS